MGIEFLLSVFIFLISLVGFVLLWVKKRNVIVALRFFSAGLFFSDVGLLCILVHCYSSNSPVLPTAIMTSLQLFTLNPDYASLMMSANCVGKTFLVCFFTMLCVLSPFVWGGTILTLFYPIASWLRFITNQHQKSYFFSELSENSLILAKSIFFKNDKSGRFVFFGINDQNNSELIEKARNLGFILFKKSETELIAKPKENVSIFEISLNQDKNFVHAKELVYSYCNMKHAKEYYPSVKIYVFNEQSETDLFFNKEEKSILPIIILNKNRLVVCNLLFTYPLYKSICENKISVVVIGAGSIGSEIIKTALYCGQLGEKYRLNITVVDKNALRIQSYMKLSMPEVFNGEYDIQFLETDVLSINFEEQLKEHCLGANYVCVCLGEDNLNIKVVTYLSAYYFRQSIYGHKRPFIAVYVRDSMKNKALSKNNKEFVVFGGDDEVYSTAMMDSELEKLSLNTHQIYCENKNINNVAAIYRDYYSKDDIYLKSNLANALHIRYKLFLLGYEMVPFDISDGKTDEFTVSLDMMELLARVEHSRWNAFMRTEGWQRLSLDRIDTEQKRSKIPEAKLHACLCSWEALDSIDKYFKEDFKYYDRNFIKYIPRVLGLTKNDHNITDFCYAIKKRR